MGSHREEISQSTPELIPGHKGNRFPGNKDVFIFVGFRVLFPPLFSLDPWLLLGGGMCLCGGRKAGPSWPSFLGCQPSGSSLAHRWDEEDNGWSERRRLNLSQEGHHHVAPLHISGIWKQMVPSVAQGNEGQT